MNKIIFFYFKIFIDIVNDSIKHKRKKDKYITIFNYIIKRVNVKKLNYNEIESNNINNNIYKYVYRKTIKKKTTINLKNTIIAKTK